jgi:hypothetical protein
MFIFKRKCFFSIAIFFITTSVYSQTGPGGVGSIDGTTELLLWLKADSAQQTIGGSDAENGDPVGEWRDQSGYGYHLGQSGSNRPFMNSAGINGVPALSFEGDGDYLEYVFADPGHSDFVNGLDGVTIFYVIESDLIDTDRGFFDTEAPDGADDVLGIRYDAAGASSGRNDVIKGGISTSGGDTQFESSADAHDNVNAQILGVDWETTGSLRLMLNGSLDTYSNYGTTTPTGQIQGSNRVLVGKGPKDQVGSQSWDGMIGEVIMFGSKLNDAQIEMVTNYLSSKFGITISNDYYAHEGTHPEDIAGIGRTNGEYHISAASSAVFKVDTTDQTSFVDGSFMMMGHDGAGLAWSSSELPNSSLGSARRVSREWKIDETIDPGQVRVTIDTDELAAPPSGYTKYVLMVDDDGDFTDATSYELVSPGADELYEVKLDPTDGQYFSIGVVEPTLGFTSSILDEQEGNDVEVSIYLNYTPTVDVQFDLATSDATATGITEASLPFDTGVDDQDYVMIPTKTVVFDAGSQQDTTFTINVNQDTEIESTETFTINLTNVTSGINLIQPLAVRINDDDNPRKLYFNATSSSLDEFGGSTSIQVNLTPAYVDATNPTTVDYSVFGGSATDTDDFSLLGSGTLTIPATYISATFDVSVVDDAIDEDDETVIIALSNPSNGSLSDVDPIQHTLTIADNDPGTLIQFNTASSSGAENTAAPTVTIVLSSLKGTDVMVDYTLSGNSTPSDDYTLAAGTITIPTGSISATIEPIIVDDAISESDETIVLTLTNPVNANLGTITSHTYTIEDNDAEFGYSGPGGVGSTDGTSALSLWLKADAGAKQSDGTTDAVIDGAVGQWEDQSGYGHDFDEVSAVENPLLRSNAINGEFALEFDGTNDILQDLDGEDYVNGISAYSLVAVIKSDVINTDKGFFDTELPDGGDDLLALRYDDGGLNSGRDDVIKFGISNGSEQQQLESEANDQTTNPQILVADWASGSDVRLYIDGTLKSSQVDGPAVSGTLAGAERVIVGTGPKESGAGTWDGLVGEILMFTTRINNAQRIIFENYLAAKYEIPINNDFYAYESTHGNFVAGIGQYDADEFHDDAQSDDILRINAPSDLSTDDYLFFGHDNASVASWALSESPSDSIYKIDREWALDVTNYAGSVNIILSDPANTLGTLPTDASGYVLLVDDNGDFSDGGTQVYDMTLDGSDYIYNGLAVNADAYVSFGTIAITSFFEIPNTTFEESEGTVSVTINLSRSSSSPTTVSYSVDGAGTATEGGGDDFTIAPSGSLTIPGGSTSADLTITLNDDADVELVETIILNLTSADNNVAIRTSQTHTLSINDNDVVTAGDGPIGLSLTNFGFWFKADKDVYVANPGALSTDGQVAGYWTDWSGKSNHATAVSGYEPTFRDNAADNVNDKPVIEFEGSEVMTISDNAFINSPGPYTEKTVVIAFETGSDVTNLQVVYEQGGGGNGLNIHIEDELLHIAAWDNDFSTVYNEITQSAVANTRYIVELEFESLGATSELRGYVNGVLVNTITVDQGDLDAHGADTGIGGMYNDSYFSGSTGSESGQGYYFTGKVLELFSANEVFNVAERTIYQNYLGGKWEVNISGGNDIFSHKTSHSYSVTGIGRSSSTAFHTSASSAGLIEISNATDLGDDEYLIIGHDNGGKSSYVTSDVPSSRFERLPLEWRVSEQNEVGNLEIVFDPSATSASPSSGDFNQYAILVDVDGDFTTGSEVFTLYQDGATYHATNLILNDGDYFAIAAFKPTIQFVPVNETGDESVADVNPVIRLAYPVDADITVDYALNGGNTTAMEGVGNDFEFTGGTASISRGDTTAIIAFTVNDDIDDTEGNETVAIDISNPSAGLFLGDDISYEYIIEDNDLSTKVDFAVSATSVSEGNGSINITLKLNQTTGTDVTVDYSISGGTSTTGEDYTLTDGTVTITSGLLTSTLAVPLIDDYLDEEDETLILTLSNPVGANLETNDLHTLTIVDDDDPPTVQIISASTAGSEGNTPANIEVNLSNQSGKDITVNYQLVSSTGTIDDDFTLVDGVLNFDQGDSLATISIGIIDDFDLEVDEQIVVEIYDGGNLSNATLGIVTQHTYTINDNDASGVNGPGGVRAASDYLYWLRSDNSVFSDQATDAAATDSDVADEWFDFSGTGNSVFATASQEPVYRNNSTDNINGKPALEFNGNEIMTMLDASGVNQGGPFTNKSAVVAFQLGSDISTRQVIYAQGGGTNGFAVLVASDSIYTAVWNDNNASAIRGAPVTAQSTGVVMLSFEDVDPDQGVIDLRLDGYYNGAQLPIRQNGTDLIDAAGLNNHNYMVLGYMNNDQINYLGSSQDYFDGKIMEVFSFNGNYSVTQRIIIENYLGAKYSANISGGSNDYFDYSALYSYGVAGIGRVGSSDFYPKAQSDSMITISNASNLDDGEFMVWGHNNGSINTYNTNDAPESIIRLNRQWRVSETMGDVGTVSFTLDTLNIPAIPSSGYTYYALMVDDDGNFATGANIYPLIKSGSQYITSSVNLSDGDYFTIGIIRPEVSFDLASSNDGEEVSPISIGISLNYAITDDLSFDISNTGGTATDVTDYNFSNETLTISSGSTAINASIDIVNDAQVESDETVILTLTDPSIGSIGSNSAHTFTINDDDNFRKASFDVVSANSSENLTSQLIAVSLNAADADNPTEIYYAVTGGTATNGGTDFDLDATGTITFAPGSSTQNIELDLIDDLLDEYDETIIIQLTGGSNATLGTNTTFTFTISDDDDPPTVSFVNSSKSGSESFQTVELAVILSSVSGKDITVPYAITGGDATPDIDLQLIGSDFMIPAGTISDSLELIVIDDAILESPDETFDITIGPADNAGNGANLTLTYTILDNDGAGIDGPGGIGNLDGQIAVWLRANDESSGFGNGVNVSQWEDNTENNNDGLQATTSAQPLYLENLINGRPAIVFDGTNDLIGINNTPDINTGGPYDKKTIFAAFRTSTDITTRQMIYEEGGGWRGLSIYIDGGLLYVSGWNERDDDGSQTTPWPSDGSGAPYSLYRTFALNTNTNYFVTMQFDFDVDGAAFNGEVRGGINGQPTLDIITNGGRLFAHGDDIGIGGKNGSTVYHDNVNGGGTNTFNGNIAEVIITNFVFNDAQRHIISNYFSSKYDITIDPTIDFYDHDANHSYDIVGIGRISAGQTHNEARGTGILKISNPSDLSDGEYLLIGHNNGAVNTWSSSGVPNNDPASFRKIERVWRADETGGDIGNISIEMINNEFISPPAGFDENYVLLVDADGDFTSGAEIYQLGQNGSTFNVDNIDLSGDKFFTVGLAKGTIGFSTATSNVLESAGNLSIPVVTNYVVSDDVTVNYTITAGTATGNGYDYVLADGVATVSGGSENTNIILVVTNDTDIESDETVEITLSSPSTGTALGSTVVHTVTINDDDTPRKANFALASITNDESVTSYDVEFTLSEVDNDNPTQVYYEVDASSSATNASDFTLTSPDVAEISAGSLSETVTIAIDDDAIDEEAEEIVINITSANNASLGTVTTFTYTITDNDDAPTVGFDVATDTDIESITPKTIEVSLSVASSKTVSVDYAANTGSSTATGGGVDYNLVAGTLTFLPGETTKSIDLNIFDDDIQESDETIVIDLSNPVNASSITTSSITFTIIDDDGGLGPTGPGGVGKTVTGSEITFWLKAGVENYSDAGFTPAIDNGEVLQWNDQGGQDQHAIDMSGSYSVSTPNLLASVASANNQAGIKFTAANSEAISVPNSETINTSSAGYTTKSYFVVFQTPSGLSGSSGTQMIYEQGGGSNGINIYLDNNTLRAGAWSVSTGWSYTDLNVSVSASELIVLVFEINQPAGVLQWFGHGSITGAFSDVSAGTPLTDVVNAHGGLVGIGGTINSTYLQSGVANIDEGHFFDGVIFEIMHLNEKKTNDANRKILFTYAEAEYGIDVAASDDLYSFDLESPTIYRNQLFGIGQEDSDNRHLSAQGLGLIRMTSPQDVDDGEYVVIAHDGADVDDFNTSELNASYTSYMSRVDREWLIAENSGDLGKIRFYVDTTALPSPSVGEDFVLIVDDDQNGDFTDGTLTFYKLYDRFGEFAVSDTVNMSDGDYFTIALATNVGVGSGDWSDPTTWLLGTVPGSNEEVTLSASAVINLDEDVTVSDLTLEGGATLNLNAFTLTVTGTLTSSGTINHNNAGTIAYTSTSGNVCVLPMTYYNIEIGGGGTKTLCGDITILNDLTINNNPTLDVDVSNNYDITIHGDWINAVNSTFAPRLGRVTFQGTTGQEITKTGTAEQFYELELDNDQDLTLGSDVDISNQLIFSVDDGLIFTEEHTLDIENSALSAINGSGASRYVVTNGGHLELEVAAGTDYVFPIGDASIYSPLTFEYQSGTVTDLVSSVTNGVHPSINTSGDYLARYWSLEPVSGTATYNVIISYDQSDFNGSDEAAIKPVKYNSYQIGDGDFVVDDVGNTITWNGLTSFSEITAGDIVALPVELLWFEATYKDQVVILAWETATESNNSHFVIERSIDGVHFEQIDIINGSGDSNESIQYKYTDFNTIAGLVYYRLVQYDFDGQFEILPIVVVEVPNTDLLLTFDIYPNPTNGYKVNILTKGAGIQQNVLEIKVSDLSGRLLHSEKLIDHLGRHEMIFNEKLASGIYMLQLIYGDKVEVMRLIVR